ncbi:MAG: hypothetical protein GXC76_01890 [Rhodanobacteraceae bacterium]|jgi:Mor family transcriptional regulator|nr:hypothetical protein [Rhodanobacteraceae bacterium]
MTRANPTALDPWSGTAGELRAVIADLFGRHGATGADALDAAERVVITVCGLFGGRSCYLPRMDHFGRAERDRALFAQANGRNTKELAERYALTVRHVQRIVAEQARVRRAERAAGRPDPHRRPPDDIQ